MEGNLSTSGASFQRSTLRLVLKIHTFGKEDLDQTSKEGQQ